MMSLSIRGLLYEFRTTLVNPALVATMALITIASLAFLPSLAAQTSQEFVLNESSVYFYENGEYHLEFIVFDNHGRAISGASVSLQVLNNSTAVRMATLTGVTSSDGTLLLTSSLPDWTYDISVGVQTQIGSGSGGSNFSAVLTPIPVGEVLPLGGFIGAVSTGSPFSPSEKLQVYFLGPNGTKPPNYEVYYAIPLNATDQALSTLPEGWMSYAGALNSDRQQYGITLEVPKNSTLTPSATILVELFTTSGKLVAASSASPESVDASLFEPSNLQVEAPTFVFTFTNGLLGFFFPLLGIMAAYSTYGRQRVTGILESVLAQPVSHEGLAISRYIAVFTSLTVMSIIAIGVIDIILNFTIGAFLPANIAVSLCLGLMVESGAFAGLIFVASRLARSTSTLVGLGIAMFSIFSFAWALIVQLVSSLLGVTYGSPAFVRLEVEMFLVNPAGFLNLLEALYIGGFGLGPTSVGTFGITSLSLSLEGTAWVLIPLLAFLLLVRTRD